MICCKHCKIPTNNKKFCSTFCRQLHKKKKRSKLERFISNEIKKDFKNIKINICDRIALGNGLELDLFFPKLNLAFEINGKMHYEFIKYFHRNIKNFNKQLLRDKLKSKICLLKNIDLIIVENFKIFSNKNAGDIYQKNIKPIILEKIKLSQSSNQE